MDVIAKSNNIGNIKLEHDPVFDYAILYDTKGNSDVKSDFYIKYDNGILITFGARNTAKTNDTIKFPISYIDNPNVSIFIQPSYSSATKNLWPKYNGGSSFIIDADKNSSSLYFRYLAIGRWK